MKLIIYPENSITNSERNEIKKISSLAEKLLLKNNISIPNKIYFYNSFQEFIKKVIPEIINYGFDKKTSEEIIKCALNNGTYGTINFNENSIIEMNFNPFHDGEYSSLEFLELLIHESLHLYLSKSVHLDINNLKFKFDKEKFIGKKEIIQFDEGYADFMTSKILNNIDIKEIKKIKIIPRNKNKPIYIKKICSLNIEKFDKIFEELLISNREKGLNIFKKKFDKNIDNELVLKFAVDEIKKFYLST